MYLLRGLTKDQALKAVMVASSWQIEPKTWTGRVNACSGGDLGREDVADDVV